MQHNDDSPKREDSPKRSRPSLLTPAQQAEADRHRILSQLETGKAGKPAVRRKKSLVWVGAGALAVAIAVIFGVWANHDDAGDAHLAAVSAAATGGSAVPAPAPAVPAAAAAQTASSDVSADEVLSSAAPAAVIQEDRAAQAQDKKQSLGEMLENNSEAAVSPAAGKHDPNMLSSALETPSANAAASQPAHKAVVKEKPKAKPATVAKTPRPKEKEKTTPEEENDIALLAALVAHTQSEERRAEPPKKPRVSLDEQLNQCRKLSKTKAAQCHERVCEGRSKTGGCKVKE